MQEIKWEDMAKALLPDEYEEEVINGTKSLHSLFSEVLSKLIRAHSTNDQEYLLSAYTFADWCSQQEDHYTSNAAGVSFFEHIFDDIPIDQVAPWIRSDTYARHSELLQQMKPEYFREIEELFKNRTYSHEREIRELCNRAAVSLAFS